MAALLVASLLTFAAPSSDPPPLSVAPPAVVLEIDAGQVHGTPIQLSWSPDSASWYLETFEGQAPNVKRHRFLVAVGDRTPRPIDETPAWAVDYWNFKSNRIVPAHPLIMIAVDEGKEAHQIPNQNLRQKAAATAENSRTGGQMSLAGSMDSSNDFANAARVLTLSIADKPISVLVDEPLTPGVTFGWSPKEYDSVAFRNEHHHGLSIYRIDGPTLEVSDTRDVLLPAWSPDGSKIAFLQQTGKKKYELRQLKVSLP